LFIDKSDILSEVGLSGLAKQLLLRHYKGLTMLQETAVTDCVVVSYPKSGNTWMRFLIFSYLLDRQGTFEEVEQGMPYVPQDWYYGKTSPPIVLKSHNSWPQKYGKVLYMVRDPRDVVISFYYWHIKTGLFEKPEYRDWTIEEYISRFMGDNFVWKTPWDKHVMDWFEHRDELTDGFLLVKYEDLLDNTLEQMHKVVVFLGMEWNQQKAERAIENCSISKMQKIEKSREKDLIAFARKGTAGQWRDLFSLDTAMLFSKRFGPTMRKFGYIS